MSVLHGLVIAIITYFFFNQIVPLPVFRHSWIYLKALVIAEARRRGRSDRHGLILLLSAF